MRKIAIFASGSGTNAENIILHSQSSHSFTVSKIYCNNPRAGIIERGHKLGVPVVVFNKNTFYNSDIIVADIVKDNVDAVILAGFLWLIPNNLLQNFVGRIINIHPALLPKYGGKGMYGMKVHESVIEAREKKSGITIHLVNEEYDKGEILFQADCAIAENDTPDDLARKIHELEYKHFPCTIESFVSKL